VVLGWMAVAGAAEIELDVVLHGRIGQADGSGPLRVVRVPKAVRPPQSVTTEAGGFTLTCSGKRREVVVWLAFPGPFPENPPLEVECTVGEHHLTIHLTNDHEVAWRRADHPTLRLSGWKGGSGRYGQWLGAGWTDAPGRLVGPDFRPVEGLGCWIEDQMVVIEVAPGGKPGAYRCVVDGREPIPVEILP
jgi:hypothetical protein